MIEPANEPARLIEAKYHQRFGRASVIGASMISGAIGKMKASKKLSTHSHTSARGLPAQARAFSYSGRKRRISGLSEPAEQRHETHRLEFLGVPFIAIAAHADQALRAGWPERRNHHAAVGELIVQRTRQRFARGGQHDCVERRF